MNNYTWTIVDWFYFQNLHIVKSYWMCWFIIRLHAVTLIWFIGNHTSRKSSRFRCGIMIYIPHQSVRIPLPSYGIFPAKYNYSSFHHPTIRGLDVETHNGSVVPADVSNRDFQRKFFCHTQTASEQRTQSHERKRETFQRELIHHYTSEDQHKKGRKPRSNAQYCASTAQLVNCEAENSHLSITQRPEENNNRWIVFIPIWKICLPFLSF